MSYKRRELKLKTAGYYDLAKEVIRQWNTDGRPRSDLEGIEMWAELVASHQSMMHRSAVKQGVIRGVRRKGDK